jgi:biotin synthase (EC 2.8.1.6)
MKNQAAAPCQRRAWITTIHNLDTSPEFYGNIITTRTYQERLDTLDKVREAGIKVCSGGIVGLGETVKDRAGLLLQLAKPAPHRRRACRLTCW